jgi:DNA-binding GntR family transcriptional regulator
MQTAGQRMKFEPVRRESTREKVHSAIRGAILDGSLRIGQRLTEITLAKEFRVSRAVIREALQQLAHDGLVEHNAYRGSRVVHLSPEQVDEIIGTRILLESEAVRLAIGHMTEANHRYLAELMIRIQEAAGDPDTSSELDLAFHEKIWELSRNETLRKILLQITAPLFAMGAIMRHSEQARQNGKRPVFQRSSHAAVIEQLKSGKADKAVDAMRQHISENWDLIRKHLEEFLTIAEGPAKATRKKKVETKKAKTFANRRK